MVNFERNARMGLHEPIAMLPPIDVRRTRPEADANEPVAYCDEYLIDLELM